MRGSILGYSKETKQGVIISEENGERYNFSINDWNEEKNPSKRDIVDFVATSDNRASDIYIIQADNAFEGIVSTETDNSKKNYTMIIYVLYGLSLLSVGFTMLVGVVMAYIKRDDFKGTIYQSHLNEMIKVFWWSLVWYIIGIITIFVLVGFLILGISYLWVLYKVIKGFIRLMDNKSFGTDENLLIDNK